MPSVPMADRLFDEYDGGCVECCLGGAVLFGILQPVPSPLMTIVEVAPEPLIVICILLLIITIGNAFMGRP